MWPNPQKTADLVTFTEEILNEKLHFLWSESAIDTMMAKFKISAHSKESFIYPLFMGFNTGKTLMFHLMYF